jgi:hypothetical protein
VDDPDEDRSDERGGNPHQRAECDETECAVRISQDRDPIPEQVFLLALAAAFYPTLLAVVVVALTRPAPARMLAAFLIGGFMASVLIGFALLVFADGTDLMSGEGGRSVGGGVQLAVGVLSLVIAAMLMSGRELPRRQGRKAKDEETKDPWSKRLLKRDSVPVAFALGIVLDLPSLWYLTALARISEANYSTSTDVALVLVFNLIMFVLIEIPLVFFIFAPQRAGEFTTNFNAWLRANLRMIGAFVAAALGAYLTVAGLVDLL